jgi:uncharacterized repeat protein (TIGR01451 family)
MTWVKFFSSASWLRVFAAVLVWGVLGIGSACANESAAMLRADLTQMLVVVEGGKETLKPVKSVKPGDLIEYRVVYTNQTAKPLRDVKAELPIPQGLEYQARTAYPAQTAEAAVAGGEFAQEPLMREVAAGKKAAVPYAEYRHLRWSLGRVGANAKVEVAARARVSAVDLANKSVVQVGAKATNGR